MLLNLTHQLIRALVEGPDIGLEVRVNDLVREAQIQPQAEERRRRVIVELVPDFIVKPEGSAGVILIERKGQGA